MLLPCGAHHDPLADGQQLIGHFQFAKGVCCTQLGETCAADRNPLPQSCRSATCARAVQLVNDSCATLLSAPYFQVMAESFKPLLDDAMALCDTAVRVREEAGTTEPVSHCRTCTPSASLPTHPGA